MSEQTTTTSTAPRSTFNRGPRPAGAGAPRGARPAGGNRRPGYKGSSGPRGRGGSDRPKPEFDQKTLSVRRVTRVVSGGRRFSFSVVVAIGDKKGGVGLGVGKAGDTAQAVNKAIAVAKKSMIRVRLTKTNSIEHDITAKSSSAKVFLMPNSGRGVVVGSSMRSIIELAGIHDVTGRVLAGTKNKLNIAAATIKALSIFAIPKNSKKAEPAIVPDVE